MNILLSLVLFSLQVQTYLSQHHSQDITNRQEDFRTKCLAEFQPSDRLFFFWIVDVSTSCTHVFFHWFLLYWGLSLAKRYKKDSILLISIDFSIPLNFFHQHDVSSPNEASF